MAASFDGDELNAFFDDIKCGGSKCAPLPRISTCSRIPASYTGTLTCVNDSLTGILVDGNGLNAVALGRFNASRLVSYASSLTSLRVSNFAFVPLVLDAALAQLTALRTLELSSVVLVGKFPDSVVQLRRLQSLDLSFNKLNASLFLLDKLPPTVTSLRLNGNQFVSPIGPITHLTALSVLNLSSNLLTGAAPPLATIPATCLIMDTQDTNCLNECVYGIRCCRSNCTSVGFAPSPFPIAAVTPNPPTPFPIGIAPTPPRAPTTTTTTTRTLPPAVTASTTFTLPPAVTASKSTTSSSVDSVAVDSSSFAPTPTDENGSTMSDTTTTVVSSDNESVPGTSSDTAVAIGVGVAGGLVCLLGLFIAIWLWRRSSKFQQPPAAGSTTTPPVGPLALSGGKPEQYGNVPDSAQFASSPRQSSIKTDGDTMDGFVAPQKMSRRTSSRRRREGEGAVQKQESNLYVPVGTHDTFATANVAGGTVSSTMALVASSSGPPPPVPRRRSSRRGHSRQSSRRRVHTVRDIYQIPPEDLQLGEQLGQGAFGVVVRADWKGTVVAVKQIRTDAVGGNSKAVEEFKREVKSMAAMPAHKNVVRLYGVSRMGNDLAAVVEYCGGGALSVALYGDAPRTFSERQLINIAHGSACGIVHLHDNNTVHRDIAARNVLLTADGQPKVADFGMARDTNGVSTSLDENVTAQDLGPIKFMAPEQLERRAYSRATDVWSFGVLLFEIFSQEKPWHGVPNLRVATMVLDGAHLEAGHKTPARVKAVMERCFARDPRERISMTEAESELRSLHDSS